MIFMKRMKKHFYDRECRIMLPSDRLQEILARHNVTDWFFYAFANRSERLHICEPSNWVLKNFSNEKVIFETGCGCGLNLIWFAQKGFIHLLGSDISHEAILAGKELACLANATIELWQDNGLAPEKLPDKIDVLLALNWTYHVDNFELNQFLHNYLKILNNGGCLIIDLIDDSYNSIPNNEYLTSDWTKPIDVRKPSEYKKRYSYESVVRAVKEAGYEILHTKAFNQVIPRIVYILCKN